jgi:hypothetical protein
MGRAHERGYVRDLWVQASIDILIEKVATHADDPGSPAASIDRGSERELALKRESATGLDEYGPEPRSVWEHSLYLLWAEVCWLPPHARFLGIGSAGSAMRLIVHRLISRGPASVDGWNNETVRPFSRPRAQEHPD